MNLDDKTIAVIGLGYVGLPVAVAFGRKRPVVAFDIREDRIAEIESGYDRTRELSAEALSEARHARFTSTVDNLQQCGIFIVTVPTPIDRANTPDLTLLRRATETVGKAMSPGSVVIYESTVYPGCTRNVCVPILQETSGLVLNEQFYVGYSPERANPGDHEHRLARITKITSGSTAEAAEAIDQLYGSIVDAGTYKASSIEVAEAAKVIENTQRDLNIALMNELSIIFHRLDLDTLEVLEAASTKWNFLPFRPGLVGGHCIGVDPYYLTYRAQEIGYHPEVILAGRRINNSMGSYVADRVARMMMRKGIPVVNSHILVLGLTFKENCPDIRNSKVFDLIEALRSYNADVDVYDPWANADEVRHEFGLDLLDALPPRESCDAIIVAVSHSDFSALGAERIRALGKPGAVLFDVKGAFAKRQSDGRL